MGHALPVRLFQTPAGVPVVREWLRTQLTAEERTIVGADLRKAQNDWPPGMPLTRSLGGGLFELRSTLPTRIVRLLCCVRDGAVVVLHAFVKKTQRTPATELEVARQRLKLL